MNLKTAFLQGESFDETRELLCQIAPEYDYPPYMGAGMKKPSFGLNDAPRWRWQVVDRALLSYELVPTIADRCTYILYDKHSTKKSQYRYNGPTSTEKVSLHEALDHLLGPVSQNKAQGRKIHDFVYLHVDDLLIAGHKVFQITAKVRKDFAVG